MNTLTTLTGALDVSSAKGVDAAWLEEVGRRCREIDSGVVECIPAEEVFARIDKIRRT